SRSVELPPMLLMSAQRSVCVGRTEQREQLIGCWTRASAGLTTLVVVSGEAGIGKSRLVAQRALGVHRPSGPVPLRACTAGAPAPYQPFVEALRDLVATAPEGQLRTDIGRHAEPLSRVLPEVAVRLGTVVPPSGIDPLGERQAAQTAIATYVAAIAR